MSKEKELEPRCPKCRRLDVVRVVSRMAEMPTDPETGTRIWKRIGRTYHHPRELICDEVLAEVTDVL